MSIITEKTSHSTSTSQATRSTSSPSKPAAVENRSQTSDTAQSHDRVSLSRESRESSASQGASLSLLSSFADNFSNKGQDAAIQEVSKTKDSQEAKPLSAEQKIEQLKSTIDSFKGLKGEALQAKLKELEKTDPALAEYLKKLLEDKDEKKSEETKEAAPAQAAEKAKGADDGAPSESFLWKPVSESDGKLVVLLPSSVSANSITVSGPSGSETVSKGGRNGSRGNGQREHFRFSKSGKDMQGPVQVSIALESGGTKTMTIANPAERNEGGSLTDGQ